MLLLFAVGGMFAAVLVATVVFLSAGEERRDVRDALRELADYELPSNMREQEMLKSIQERVVAPFVSRLSAPLRAVHAGRLQRDGAGQARGGRNAGRPRRRPVHGPQGVRGVLDRVLALVLLQARRPRRVLRDDRDRPPVGDLFFGPDVWVQRKIDQRQHEIATGCPTCSTCW